MVTRLIYASLTILWDKSVDLCKLLNAITKRLFGRDLCETLLLWNWHISGKKRVSDLVADALPPILIFPEIDKARKMWIFVNKWVPCPFY